MDSILKVYNENNELEEVEVLDFYHLEDYDHEYILYTKNETDGDVVTTYVSIIKQISEDQYQFEAITDKEEAKAVNEMINKEIKELMNQG